MTGSSGGHDPLAFLHHPRVLPQDRPVAERLRDYAEVHGELTVPVLRQQASRCMGCAVPFCHDACPLHNLIPDWNALVTRDDWRSACDRLHRTNNFPEFTGRLCPAPCEAACVLAIHDQPVAIKEVERAIIDRGFLEGWVGAEPPPRRTGRRVAVVGSGPAGLAAAQQLARAGHLVAIYEQDDRPGGLLRYGIPDFKFAKSLLDRRLLQLRREGVRFHCGVRVGSQLPVATLRRRFDAVVLAIGARRARELDVPGRGLAGIHLAMDYLPQQNRRVAGLPPRRDHLPITAAAKRVVILGGGDTGADCLGNVLREGCTAVEQLELRPQPPRERAPGNPWPSWPIILRTSPAHEEGGGRRYAVETVAFEGVGGRVGGVRLRRLRPRPHPGGAVVLDPVEGQDHTLAADLVLLALGFQGPELDGAVAELGLACGPGGGLIVADGGATGVPGVFAAGDAVRGASLVVTAIADGRAVAAAVHRSLARRAA
ncbi:MAG TPA: glutamate synthase subunit beta [Candidatus Micrarchaeia archaeon]|nr:glutamate synthase subunit beta [Candidatus Micrarchaeia archaeon]